MRTNRIAKKQQSTDDADDTDKKRKTYEEAPQPYSSSLSSSVLSVLSASSVDKVRRQLSQRHCRFFEVLLDRVAVRLHLGGLRCVVFFHLDGVIAGFSSTPKRRPAGSRSGVPSRPSLPARPCRARRCFLQQILRATDAWVQDDAFRRHATISCFTPLMKNSISYVGISEFAAAVVEDAVRDLLDYPSGCSALIVLTTLAAFSGMSISFSFSAGLSLGSFLSSFSPLSTPSPWRSCRRRSW